MSGSTLSPTCECCGKRWGVSLKTAEFEGRQMAADLCETCEQGKHAPQICRKCMTEDDRRSVAWYCARLAHAVQYHPRLLEIRNNMPDDPADTGGSLKSIGRIPYPE